MRNYLALGLAFPASFTVLSLFYGPMALCIFWGSSWIGKTAHAARFRLKDGSHVVAHDFADGPMAFSAVEPPRASEHATEPVHFDEDSNATSSATSTSSNASLQEYTSSPDLASNPVSRDLSSAPHRCIALFRCVSCLRHASSAVGLAIDTLTLFPGLFPRARNGLLWKQSGTVRGRTPLMRRFEQRQGFDFH